MALRVSITDKVSTGSYIPPAWGPVVERRGQRASGGVTRACARSNSTSQTPLSCGNLACKLFIHSNFLDKYTNLVRKIFGWDFEGLELAIQQQLQECSKLFEDHADATVSKDPTGAIIQYSAALSLNLPNAEDIRIKRGNALAVLGKWKDALEDAEEVRFCLHVEQLSPFSSSSNTLLTKWARAALARGSVNEALDAATKVCLSQ